MVHCDPNTLTPELQIKFDALPKPMVFRPMGGGGPASVASFGSHSNRIRNDSRRFFFISLVFSLPGWAAPGCPTPATDTTLPPSIDLRTPEFRGGSLPSLAWLSMASAIRRSSAPPAGGARTGHRALRRRDPGLKTILVPAARLVPSGDSTPLGIEEYSWSSDGRRLLSVTNPAQIERPRHRAVLGASTSRA